MYKPKFMTVFGITAWFAVTMFGGEEHPYFKREGCPTAFKNEEACGKFCDYLNCIP